MASLTTLSKTLIALVVVGTVASVVWHVGLKERFGGEAVTSVQVPATPEVAVKPTAPPVVIEPAVPAAPVAAAPSPPVATPP